MRPAKDLKRELEKVSDALNWADRHFQAEGQMNAAAHMNHTVRLTPLASAIDLAALDVERLIEELSEEAD